jgi:hypothetical protein
LLRNNNSNTSYSPVIEALQHINFSTLATLTTPTASLNMATSSNHQSQIYSAPEPPKSHKANENLFGSQLDSGDDEWTRSARTTAETKKKTKKMGKDKSDGKTSAEHDPPHYQN